MGIIKKQSIFSTFILYIGFLVGIFNNLILLPQTLSISELGLVSVLFGMSTIFYSYSSFGLVNIINKFSNYYKNYLSVKENDLLSFSFLTAIVASLALTGVYLIFQEKIFDLFHQKELFLKYKNYIPISGFFLLIQTILIIYTNTYYKTVWTNFVKEVVFRMYNTILIVLLLFKIVDFELYLKLYLTSYIFTSFLLTLYLVKSKKIALVGRVSKVTKKLMPYMWKMGLISWTGDIVFSIGQQIDVLVIQAVLTSEKAGYYYFIIGFTALIMAPQRALVNISFPVLADLWRRKDIKNIKVLYQKSSNTMLLIGGFVFLIITLNARSIFDLVNKDGYYAQYFLTPGLIVFLGIAKLVELGTGVNASIIYTSRNFSFWIVDFIGSIFIILIIIIFNYYLTKRFGLIGIGYASIFAYSLHNFFRLGYIYIKMKIHPFSINIIKTSMIIVAVYFAMQGLDFYINDCFNAVFKNNFYFRVSSLFIVKSMLIFTAYILLAFYLNVSEDMNIVLVNIKARIKRKLNFISTNSHD